MANFKKYTRYTNGFTTKNRSNVDFLVLREPLNLAEADGDVFVSIDQSLLNRPDLISQKAYETPDLWWAIYEFNNIKDPLFELKIGQILRIPAKDRLIDAIDKIGTT
jgi:hypothetical protein